MSQIVITAASGLSASVIKAALCRLSDNKINVMGLLPPSGSLTTDELTSRISELESYGSGYMYRHEYAVIEGSVFHYRTHFVHDYDDRESSEFLTYNRAILWMARQNTIIRVGCDADESSYEDYQKIGDLWVSLGGYDSALVSWVRPQYNSYGFFLWEGVRSQVAAACGYKPDGDFNALFDKVVAEAWA